MTALCVPVIGICLIPTPHVKSPIHSVFWHIQVFAAQKNYQRGCPSPNPSCCERIYYVLTICTYFHCLTHCICLCDAPGFIMSEFYLAKLPDPVVLSMYRTADLKCGGTRLWRRVGIRSVQVL